MRRPAARPVGGPPAEVFQAVEDFLATPAEERGPAPAYPQTGPPHFTEGMFAEVSAT
jgi:hypothetical protein